MAQNDKITFNPPIPENEKERLAFLHSLNILDTLPSKQYDDIVNLVSYICQVPISLISLVDENRQWFKSKIGFDVQELPRDTALCAFTVAQNTPFIIEDVQKDERFRNKTFGIRFYAGIQIKVDDKNIGSLCAIDTQPRSLSEKQLECMKILADHVMNLILNQKYEQISSATIDQVKQMYEEKEIEEQLSDIKSNLITNISHELKTPLNAIVSTYDALQELVKDEAQLLMIKTLQSATEDLMFTFTNLMILSQTSQIILQKEIFSLSHRLQVVIDNYKFKANEKLITLNYIDKLENIKIESDAERILTVVSNLLSNAVKFTPSGKNITVTSEFQKTDHNILFYCSIQDEGIGIEPSYTRDIFKPLMQIDMSSKKIHSGFGNGLASSKKIVDAMKGEINYSSLLNQGTTFWIVIPVIPHVEDRDDGTSISKLDSILVVDDNSLNRNIASTLLKKLVNGIKLDVAENGLEAVGKVKTNKFDMVLMDCQMPIKDGFEATLEIRKENKDLIIMALTASSENKDLKRCHDVGMNEVLTKPICVKKLKHVLEKWFKI